jgi:hypothetical protein
MDNWGGSTIYDLAMALHTERVARGAAAQHRAATLGARPGRARLAAALAALAARLDPAPPTEPGQVSHAPAAPA